jgi:hypothetical protein
MHCLSQITQITQIKMHCLSQIAQITQIEMHNPSQIALRSVNGVPPSECR